MWNLMGEYHFNQLTKKSISYDYFFNLSRVKMTMMIFFYDEDNNIIVKLFFFLNDNDEYFHLIIVITMMTMIMVWLLWWQWSWMAKSINDPIFKNWVLSKFTYWKCSSFPKWKKKNFSYFFNERINQYSLIIMNWDFCLHWLYESLCSQHGKDKHFTQET